MDNYNERFAAAQWVLERNLAWIAAAEIKVGVVITLQVAMLGGLAAVFSTSEAAARTAWAYIFLIWTIGSSCGAFCSAGAVVFPRTGGPSSSLLFFGRIAIMRLADYQERFRDISDQELLDDWLAQIHRNAEIALSKHHWVRISMKWSFVTAILWAVSVILLVKV